MNMKNEKITREEEEYKLPKEQQFKPFDKVIAKTFTTEWTATLFSHESEGLYCCEGKYYSEILPFNEQTAKLIGTSEFKNISD